MKGFLWLSGVEGSREMVLDMLASLYSSEHIASNVSIHIPHIKTITTRIMTIIMPMSNHSAILRDIGMEAKGYLLFCNIFELLN